MTRHFVHREKRCTPKNTFNKRLFLTTPYINMLLTKISYDFLSVCMTNQYYILEPRFDMFTCIHSHTILRFHFC